MDESKIKRLLIIVAISIVVIMLIKTVMIKTAVKVNQATTEKKLSAKGKTPEETPLSQQKPAPVDTLDQTPAASGVSKIP